MARRQTRDPSKEKAKRPLQYAAVPYRRTEGGVTEVMLMTSRETRRWVIPKGWPIRGAKPHASAAREALEEAGLIGRAGPEAIGSYRYDKRLKSGVATRCKVDVFPLAVTGQRKRWREKGQRKLRWFTLAEAAKAVQEPGLRKLLRQLDALVPDAPGAEA
ncbi:8-oxo-dGTP pyrophosphatase MutT (NUDIX family) [Rhodoplanes tepidamans]|uniref:NUDIX hydrolase n=1 Tax=Rhodoplanes TaxID=29407 RepID=UPI00277F8622|nr:8-oxo-dGTP pyrophosphatase MutT (NUDIX family) [Rhodoplanes tepidamans]